MTCTTVLTATSGTAASGTATANAAPRTARPRRTEPTRPRSPVRRARSGVATGCAAAARVAGHFVVACVSVAVLGADAGL
jgi:hypothetical protein